MSRFFLTTIALFILTTATANAQTPTGWPEEVQTAAQATYDGLLERHAELCPDGTLQAFECSFARFSLDWAHDKLSGEPTIPGEPFDARAAAEVFLHSTDIAESALDNIEETRSLETATTPTTTPSTPDVPTSSA